MAVLTPKRPDEALIYTLDLRRELQPADAIKTYTLTQTAGTAVLTDETNAGVAITVLISGGANGETNALSLSVTTENSQIIERDYTLLVADGVTAVYPSTSTKRFIVERAFGAMGLSPYEFDPTPEEYNEALDDLDMMMAEWAVSSLNVGYAFPPTIGGGDLDDASGIPDFSVNAVSLSLAQRMAANIGKTLSRETNRNLTQAMVALRTKLAVIPEYALPWRTPIGAGNKPWSSWYPFVGQFAGNQ